MITISAAYLIIANHYPVDGRKSYAQRGTVIAEDIAEHGRTLAASSRLVNELLGRAKTHITKA